MEQSMLDKVDRNPVDIHCILDNNANKRKRNGDLDESNEYSREHKQTRRHAFHTNVLDHCETPKVAYIHLQNFLDVLGRNLHIEPATKMSIWDPFYCDGSTKRIFTEIGFFNVIHENMNFYELIRERKIPKHDILVTNPPYSDDHIDRLLDFVITHQVPRKATSCLLLPNWVSRKSDYQSKFVKPIEDANYELLYLAPLEPYTYTMPTWVSEKDRPEHVGGNGQTTPYLSSWYLIVPKLSKKQSLLDRLDIISKQQKPPIWVVAKTVKGVKWKIQKAGQRIKGTGKRNNKSKRGKKQSGGTNLFTEA